MKIELRIMASGIRRHPARIILTSLAMVAASCIVVWVVSGYDALVSQFKDSAERTMGRYDMVVVPASWKKPVLAAGILEEINKDPAVAETDPVMQCKVTITRGDGFAGEMMMGPGGGRRGGPGAGGGRGAGMGPGGGQRGVPPSADGMRQGGPRTEKGGMQPAGTTGTTRQNSTADSSSTGSAAGQGEAPYQEYQSPGGQNANGAPSQAQPTPRPNPMMMMGTPLLAGTDASKEPSELVSGKWLAGDDSSAVISSGVAERLKVDVGGELLVKSQTGEYKLKVAGITSQVKMSISLDPSRMPAPGSLTRGPGQMPVYVPMGLARRISGEQSKISLINICLRKEANPVEFRDRWEKILSSKDPKAEVLSIKDLETALEQNRMASSSRMQAYSATGISLMAALFIIFTTLSMGVHERIRQFAIMRAVALTRAQIALMITLESLVLALIGWGGGLAAGWGLLKIISHTQPTLFPNGASLGSWCILLTGASAFGGALLASLIPAWKATKISPMDAFSPPSTFHRFHLPTAAVAAGLLLICVNPLLVFVVPMPDSSRYFIHAAIGCTTLAIGFLLLTPLAMLLAERIFGPLISKCLFIDPRLLKSQLTGNMWRTLGTTISLSIGLGLFMATMTWGYSMLQPFVPGDWAPDALFAFQSGGIPDSEMDSILQIKGLRKEQCLKLAVDQPNLADDITGSEARQSVTKQGNVIMIGLDPQAAFGGTSPLLKSKFVQGDPEEAIQKLKQGRYCIVPDHFLRSTGLKTGDSFKMIPPEAPGSPVEYKIAAAVALPGWHWMTKFSGLRMRSGRSAAMVFADFAIVRQDFKVDKINFVWTNLDKDAKIGDIGNAMREIADRNLGERRPVNAQGMWSFGASNFGQSLRVSTRDDVRTRIGSRADGMIWGMCQLPLITLLVSSLAVVNTVMASVRVRRWEMGVLRAIGITRFGLVRMILAESILIGIVSCLVSMGFGVMAGWCGTGISQYVSFFGGLDTPLVVPWTKIALAGGATLLICLAAALWPAISTGSREPLELLQDGRASM